MEYNRPTIYQLGNCSMQACLDGTNARDDTSGITCGTGESTSLPQCASGNTNNNGLFGPSICAGGSAVVPSINEDLALCFVGGNATTGYLGPTSTCKTGTIGDSD